MPKNVESCAIASMSDVWECYRLELIAVEDQIRQNLDSKVALVNTVAAHILNSGGKRIRPLLLILCARLARYTGRDDVILASLIEYIHTATLLHDDVVDHAEFRRGRRTAGGLWGNQVAILVGDYLYSKAICHIVGFRNQDVNECLSEACRKMAEGELMQLSYKDDASISEREYVKVVAYKTGSLIAAACRIGAVVADGHRARVRADGQGAPGPVRGFRAQAGPASGRRLHGVARSLVDGCGFSLSGSSLRAACHRGYRRLCPGFPRHHPAGRPVRTASGPTGTGGRVCLAEETRRVARLHRHDRAGAREPRRGDH